MISNLELLNSKREFMKSTNLNAMSSIDLNPEEASRFIDLCVDSSYWLKNVRVIKMKKNEQNLRYMDFSSDKPLMRPAAFFSSSDYIKEVAEGKQTLSTTKWRGAFILRDDDLESGIEGAAFADSLMGLISTRAANEIDQALYVANTTSTGFASNDIRHTLNGFRYNLLAFVTDSGTLPTAANELDANSTGAGNFKLKGGIVETSTGEPFLKEIKLKKMLSTLPNRYKANWKDLRYFMNPVFLADYAEALSDRQTPLGDSAIIGKAPADFAGIPLVGIPQMPVTYESGSAGIEEFGTGTYGDILLTNRQNFAVGMHRSLTIEASRSAADEGTYFFFSTRLAVAIQDPEAAVILTNVTNG